MALAPGIRPIPGQVLICDYGPNPDDITGRGVTKGPLAVKPEIWKERHAVVVSTTNGAAIVVPFSTKTPEVVRRCHVLIKAGTYTVFDQTEDSWAKCDLIESVSYKRLSLPFDGGTPAKVFLSKPHFYAIRVATLNALALGSIAQHLIDPSPKPEPAPAVDNLSADNLSKSPEGE